MKRIVPILIVGIMVLSGLGAAAVSHTAQKPMENVDRWDAECQ